MNTGIDCKGREWEEISLGRAKNIAQYRSGKLTALFRVKIKNDTTKNTWWLCKCDCGNLLVVRGVYITKEKSKSCGCTWIDSGRKNSGYVDLSGQQFGSLRVLSRAPGPKWTKKAYYKCLCSCGNECIAQGCELKSGHVRTCGCGIGLSRGEEKIKNILDNYNLKYIYNKVVFKDLITSGGGHGRYDFVLINSNNQPYRIIEFDGLQHYKQISFYYDKNVNANLEYTQTNDIIKNQYALDHNIPLVRIPYTELQHIDYNTIMGDKFLIKGNNNV